MQAARRNLLKTGLMCTGAAAAAGVSLPASAAVEPNGYIACVIDKSSRAAKLKRAFEELP